jgi:hypothetical protein
MGTIVATLYQHLRRPLWHRHPLPTGAAAVAVVWLLWTGAQLLVVAVGLAWLGVAIRRRTQANAVRDAGLRARAEYEHRLSLGGDLRGIYGRYPPVAAGVVPGSAKSLPVALFRWRRLDRRHRLHVWAVMLSIAAVFHRRKVARRCLHQRRI